MGMGMGMRYRMLNQVLTSKVDGELVFMDPVKGEYYGLNGSGTFLLESLLELQDPHAAAAAAAERFDAPVAEIEEDLTVLIEDLLLRDLLQRV